MTFDFNIHTILEAIGLTTVGLCVLVPIYGIVWEVSKARYLKQQSEEVR